MELLSNTLNMKRLDNVELFSEAALLAYLSDNEFGKDALKFTSGVKVLHEIYKRFTEKDTIIEALRGDTIQKIAAYVKKNPRASSDEQAKVIKKHLDDFAVKVALITGEC
ncbi:uncharacterized protein LOC130656201 [Hydractinia symbiolongicarpus]|uniref:uncharacterized protein LOC130656201 n=1 Tax=Hydractinia symbiolongicarpus TaxID=13093 RepID=UPI00254E182D|nr:uncharacterized protein LOC130656201 [Hydractinia symbiolongicarpus]